MRIPLLVLLAAACAATVAFAAHADVQTGSIVRTYSAGNCGRFACWTCDGPVALDNVEITVDSNAVHEDAVKLAAGCTGSIGRLTVVTSSADGVKIAEGAHDVTVAGGSVECVDKAPDLHQDAVQAMGGTNVLLEHLALDCGRPAATLIDSNFMVKQAGSSTRPPSGIVCDSCTLGPDAAHTVNIETSIGSGVRGSVVCPGKYPRLTFTVGAGAIDPVNQANTLPASCP